MKKQNTGAASVLKPDTVLKNYWRDNGQFADLFNAVLFGGKPVIKAGDLEEADTEESSVLEHGAYAEAIRAARDGIRVCKRSTGRGIRFALLGLENQEHVDYAMPLRVMGYDYGTYKKQYEKNAGPCRAAAGLTESEYLSGMKRTDRFAPVITVVVYYGEEAWDGAPSLHGILDIPEEMRPYVNDYRMLLVEAGRNDLVFHNTNNMDFFNMLKIVRDRSIPKKESKEKVIRYAREHDVDKTVLMTFTGATNCRIDYNKLTEKGGAGMYSIFEEERQEGFEEGLEQGLERGLEQGLEQGLERGLEQGLEQGLERGRLDGIVALVESLQEMEIPYARSRQQLMVKFSLSEDTAQEYMDRFWK